MKRCHASSAFGGCSPEQFTYVVITFSTYTNGNLSRNTYVDEKHYSERFVNEAVLILLHQLSFILKLLGTS